MINMTHHKLKCTSVLKVGNQKYVEKLSSWNIKEKNILSENKTYYNICNLGSLVKLTSIKKITHRVKGVAIVLKAQIHG